MCSCWVPSDCHCCWLLLHPCTVWLLNRDCLGSLSSLNVGSNNTKIFKSCLIDKVVLLLATCCLCSEIWMHTCLLACVIPTVTHSECGQSACVAFELKATAVQKLNQQRQQWQKLHVPPVMTPPAKQLHWECIVTFNSQPTTTPLFKVPSLRGIGNQHHEQ